MEKFKNQPFVKAIGFNRLVLIGVIILMYFLFALLTPILHGGASFLKYERVLSALNYAYFIGFLGLGVTFVIATGGIDFSIGPVMFTSALISGYCLKQYHLPLGLAIVISLLIGVVFGILNGYFVAYRFLPSFITSMASMQIAKGVGSVFTKTQSVTWPAAGMPNSWFRSLVRWGNVPTGLILLFVVAAICAVVLNKTKAGRYILCIGTNKEAVRLSGVNTKKWEMLAYVLCGLLAGAAAIFYVGAYTTVQPGLGDTFNNEAIAACVMGGTSMAGGIASMLGTVIGALIVALMQEGILAMGFTISYQYVLTGIIVLVAVTADTLSRKRKV
ncbi:MAG TPA: ABC transporter permease [Ruminococcaceae bacterium]|jgi:ribose transport system permease protein|nr:ABC transporter permease [Oscillospiraceae bacterium]HBQ46171.1 ABC transporter permease [Oscillospiraceae bacterium]HBT91048.1 ABC transporter permease [Oscillospiraceae bacterium]